MPQRKDIVEIAKMLLNAFSEEKKDKLIEYVMKEDQFKRTALFMASDKGDEPMVQLLLGICKEEKNKLIPLLMKQDHGQHTALHIACQRKHEKIVQLLLNVFGEDEKDKLIDFVTKEDHNKNTALHLASDKGLSTCIVWVPPNERIVQLLLNTFKEEKQKLIEYVMKENDSQKRTALQLASQNGNEKIVKLLEYIQ